MLKKHLFLVIVLVITGAAITFVWADWVPGDGHKMHFPQLPDEAGWDVNATNPIILADDWMCSETGWVKDIHFWGSWMHGVEGQIVRFNLSIHRDIPADPPQIPYSRPGETLWEREITNFVIQPIDPPTAEGWYDPVQGLILPEDHQAYFQYNIFLDSSDWFWQDSGTVYWLNISATVADPSATQWGWKSSLNHWNDDAVRAMWGELNWIDLWEPPDFEQSLDLSFVITGGKEVIDTCEYYKPSYGDYAPNGMPDFDQKQDQWTSSFNGNWSWCGPVALANCLWWFDSKFEPNPVDPRPFYPGPGNPTLNDGYPLISSYDPNGTWDDHDTNNVMPFIRQLMPMCNTDGPQPGTNINDLQTGLNNWLASVGLTGRYTSTISLGPTFEEIRDSILSCQDVILLLGFYELLPGDECQWLGGHYVTAAGVCTTSTDICISDPMFDGNEGEPPAGSSHGSSVHNDAYYVSAPHGTIHHDRYHLQPNQYPCQSPATWMFTDYPNQWPDVMVFENQNPVAPGAPPANYQGNQIIVLLDGALIICPVTPQPQIDTVKCEPQGGAVNPNHPPTYWYDVIPGGGTGRCDFHVKVYDSILANYSNWVEPAGWQHTLHKVGSDWWVSWWDSTCSNAIFNTFRFQFDNSSNAVWSDWVTSNSGTNNPTVGGVDSTANHTADSNGYGYHVHVPLYEEPQQNDTCEYYKSPYSDYAPFGVPDFDQKQDGWQGIPHNGWSYCGPVALADCFWWMDSRLEVPGSPPPPTVNDNYPLVQNYNPSAVLDDHDPTNVLPFVDSLAFYSNCSPTTQGTWIQDLFNGARQWITNHGLDVTDNKLELDLIPSPDYDLIRDKILESENVIMLLGFYEDQGGECCRLGGHYVTAAGVCTTETRICISDPWFDNNEGEPPLAPHAPSVHNDAQYISGPHGTIHHDAYNAINTQLPCAHPQPPIVELTDYPDNWNYIMNFLELNQTEPPMPPCQYSGTDIYTMVDWIIEISPCCHNRGNVDHIIGPAGPIDVADLTYLVAYIFSGGAAPPCIEEGNVDAIYGPAGPIDVADITYLVAYLFSGGPPPPACP